MAQLEEMTVRLPAKLKAEVDRAAIERKEQTSLTETV
jgi:hypothetical protein